MRAKYIKFRYHARQATSRALKPIYYLSLLPEIKRHARNCGYAVAVHGSMKRDFDLLIVPWIDKHLPFPDMLEYLNEKINGHLSENNPFAKPHGRSSWVIILPYHRWIVGAYLDIGTFATIQPIEEINNGEKET